MKLQSEYFQTTPTDENNHNQAMKFAENRRDQSNLIAAIFSKFGRKLYFLKIKWNVTIVSPNYDQSGYIIYLWKYIDFNGSFNIPKIYIKIYQDVSRFQNLYL